LLAGKEVGRGIQTQLQQQAAAATAADEDQKPVNTADLAIGDGGQSIFGWSLAISAASCVKKSWGREVFRQTAAHFRQQNYY